MSKVAKQHIVIPQGVSAIRQEDICIIEGAGGKLQHKIPSLVQATIVDSVITVGIHQEKIRTSREEKNAWMYAGTTRSLLNNMIIGVSSGFTKKLLLRGVGYRAQLQAKKLLLNLGYSHDVVFPIPDDVTVTVPLPTEIVIAGIDKQRVGQVAVNIRRLRPPEPYKGKGIHYHDEQIVRKEVKKKKK